MSLGNSVISNRAIVPPHDSINRVQDGDNASLRPKMRPIPDLYTSRIRMIFPGGGAVIYHGDLMSTCINMLGFRTNLADLD